MGHSRTRGALDEWAAAGKTPPASVHPLLTKNQLVSRKDVKFPKIAEIPLPDYMPQVWRADYRPKFAKKGIIRYEPPRLGTPYYILVPQVGAGGNDLGGVPLPEIAVPLGTFTGWNINLPQLRELNFLGGLIVSFYPFAKDQAERESSGDSRLSIAERYPARDVYLRKVAGAAEELVKQRLMLPEDVPFVIKRARTMWAEIVERPGATRSATRE